MSTPFSVRASPEAETAGAVAAVVASLPVSFTPATTATDAKAADVTAAAGRTGWTQRAVEAIMAGSRGIVVAAPVPEDPTALAAAAAEHGAVVVLDQQWAGNPVLAESNDARLKVTAAALADAVLLDSVAYAAPGTDPTRVLADHLAAVLQAGIDLDGLTLVQLSTNGYTVAGKLANGSPAALHGIATAAVAAAATISILTTTGRTDITLPDASAAWPAEVRTVTPAGATTLPSLYESSHRHSWRRIRELLDGGRPSTDLQRFAALTSLVSRLTE